MVEIALCLAIIGFALVAIVGVLPTGLNVQRDNRQETIINQEAIVWMDAIRNGAQGYDDLTNYVTEIIINWTRYPVGQPPVSGQDTYTRTNATVTSVGGVAGGFSLLNGGIIVGLLSTPKYVPPLGPLSGGTFRSNYVTAYVRSMSGAAVEKFPQADPEILANAFNYRMVTEIVPYAPVDPYAMDVAIVGTNAAVARQRTVAALQNNSYDIRLFFRWPVLPSGEAGNSRQTFRLFTGGTLTNINFVNWPPLYFIQPSSYVHAP